MKPDPEIDDFICKHLGIEPPMTYAKLKSAALSRDLLLKSYMTRHGVRFVLNHEDPVIMYKTKTAAFREGLIRWIITHGNI